MNVTESCHVQTLIRFVLGLDPTDPFPSGPRDPAADREAAVALAERAYKTLSAGLSGDDVRKAWAERFPDKTKARKKAWLKGG